MRQALMVAIQWTLSSHSAVLGVALKEAARQSSKNRYSNNNNFTRKCHAAPLFFVNSNKGLEKN